MNHSTTDAIESKAQENAQAAENLLRNVLSKLQITLQEHQQLQAAVTTLARKNPTPNADTGLAYKP